MKDLDKVFDTQVITVGIIGDVNLISLAKENFYEEVKENRQRKTVIKLQSLQKNQQNLIKSK